MVIVAVLTYMLTVQAERQRQLVIGRQAEQLRDASIAVVSVANQVGASLGAADHIIRAMTLNGSADELETGRKRWNAADSVWIADKIGLAHVMERAVQSEAIDAAWSHMDSTVFALGEALTSAFVVLHRPKVDARLRTATLLVARRDTAQAALERFLHVMQPALAAR